MSKKKTPRDTQAQKRRSPASRASSARAVAPSETPPAPASAAAPTPASAAPQAVDIPAERSTFKAAARTARRPAKAPRAAAPKKAPAGSKKAPAGSKKAPTGSKKATPPVAEQATGAQPDVWKPANAEPIARHKVSEPAAPGASRLELLRLEEESLEEPFELARTLVMPQKIAASGPAEPPGPRPAPGQVVDEDDVGFPLDERDTDVSMSLPPLEVAETETTRAFFDEGARQENLAAEEPVEWSEATPAPELPTEILRRRSYLRGFVGLLMGLMVLLSAPLVARAFG